MKLKTLHRAEIEGYQFEEILVITNDGAVRTGNQFLIWGATGHGAR